MIRQQLPEHSEGQPTPKELEFSPEDELFISIMEARLQTLEEDGNTLTHTDLSTALDLAKEEFFRRARSGEAPTPLSQLVKELYSVKEVHPLLQPHVDSMMAHITGAEAKFKELADKDIDPLTRSHNRARFNKDIEAFLNDKRETASPFALFMIDLDEFKSVNDTHGHLAGDKVLRDVSSAIRMTLRGGDSLYRYGGDELVVLAHLSIQDAHILAERLVEAVRAVEIATPEERTITITCSIGVASSTQVPAEDRTPDTLIALADHEAYEAKQSGRNRFSVSQAPIVSEI